MAKILLFIIILSGLILRIAAVDEVPFWFDELWTAVYHAQADSLGTLWKNLNHPLEANLPFYAFFIFLWEKIFGSSEVSLKIPSLIAGVLSIFFIYKLAKKAFSDREAILAAAFVAFLSTPLYYSLEARGYSFLFLFCILNMFSTLDCGREIVAVVS